MNAGWWVVVVLAVVLAGMVAYRRSRSGPVRVRDPFVPYVNGLLTTLARAPEKKPFVLRTDRPLPKLTDLTKDPAGLAYLARLPAPDERLTVESVIGYLLGRALYPRRDDLEIDTLLPAKLPGPDGQLVDSSFRLKVTRRERPWQMVITIE
jgi:hypothetical protein